jgi:selenocysteine-specific elongation factor
MGRRQCWRVATASCSAPYSPAFTIGGARVLDPLPQAHRAHAEQVRALAAAGAREAAALMVAEAGATGAPAPLLAARLGVDGTGLEALLSGQAGIVAFGAGPEAYLSAEALASLGRAAREALEAFHASNPLKPAMAREELRRRVFLRTPEGVFEGVLASLVAARSVKLGVDAVALSGHEVHPPTRRRPASVWSSRRDRQAQGISWPSRPPGLDRLLIAWAELAHRGRCSRWVNPCCSSGALESGRARHGRRAPAHVAASRRCRG